MQYVYLVPRSRIAGVPMPGAEMRGPGPGTSRGSWRQGGMAGGEQRRPAGNNKKCFQCFQGADTALRGAGRVWRGQGSGRTPDLRLATPSTLNTGHQDTKKGHLHASNQFEEETTERLLWRGKQPSAAARRLHNIRQGSITTPRLGPAWPVAVAVGTAVLLRLFLM